MYESLKATTKELTIFCFQQLFPPFPSLHCFHPSGPEGKANRVQASVDLSRSNHFNSDKLTNKCLLSVVFKVNQNDVLVTT